MLVHSVLLSFRKRVTLDHEVKWISARFAQVVQKMTYLRLNSKSTEVTVLRKVNYQPVLNSARPKRF
jgi:hypothetical protein